ncbi:hypothetical protein ONZ45_g14842 [Pleurotus djamor]|nr:hypothetical protein ONZ45_g14842 [Pleurotus djamor]
MIQSSDAGLKFTPEMRRLLDQPGFISLECGGSRLRELYVDGSAGFDVDRLSNFGRMCFMAQFDEVQRLVESGQAPPLDGTVGAYEFGYATLIISGAQRIQPPPSVKLRHDDLLRYLISKGMPVDVPDIVGFTALYHSLVSPLAHVDIARTLITAGKADVNHQSRYGDTILMGAFQLAHRRGSDVVNLLMEHGADLDIVDADGMSGRQMFVKCGPAVAACVNNWLKTREGVRSGGIVCATCGGKGLHVCARCKVVRYCSATCQKSDWATHKRSCTPASPSNTVTVKPFYNPAMGHIYPTASLYGGHVDDSYNFQPRKESKKSRPLIVKIQLPFDLSAGRASANSTVDLLVYTKKKDFVCGIRKSDNARAYNEISRVVREKGVAGAKAYFSAHLAGKDELVIVTGQVLDAQPW